MRKLVILIGASVLLTGCADTAINSAVDAIVAKRLFCTQNPPIDFTYTPKRPDISDTKETIRQIRKSNAARDAICEPPTVKPLTQAPSE